MRRPETWLWQAGEGLGRSKSSNARFLSFSEAENYKNRVFELLRLGQEGLEACGGLKAGLAKPGEGLGRSKSSNARFLSFSEAENYKNSVFELLRLGQEGLEACGGLKAGLAKPGEGLGRSKTSIARFWRGWKLAEA